MATKRKDILCRDERYKSPEVDVISIGVQNMLCQSGNEPMREYDYGDGGFSES